jgi:hypothetical protein
MTGFTQLEYTLSGKWLELLKEMPGMTHTAVLREKLARPPIHVPHRIFSRASRSTESYSYQLVRGRVFQQLALVAGFEIGSGWI